MRWLLLFVLAAALPAQQTPDLTAEPIEDSRTLVRQAFAFRDQNQLAEADNALQRAAESDPALKPFLLMELARLRETRGELESAAEIARTIARDHPASSVAVAAKLRLPAIYAAMGRQSPGNLASPPRELATQAIRETDAIKVDELTERHFLDAADALAAAGWPDLASDIRLRVLREYPPGRFTEQTFDHLSAADPSPLHSLSFDATVKLADHLSRVNRFPEALELLESARRRFPKQRTTPLLRYTNVRSLFHSRNYDQVIRAPRLKSRDQYYLSAELLRARAFWRINRNQEFLSISNRIVKSYPKSAEAAEAKQQLSRYYTIDQKNYPRAARLLEESIKRLGNGTEGENLWSLGWVYTVSGNDVQALETFQRYLAAFPDADYTTNVLFWSGKVHERRGNLAERDTALKRLIAYYPYAYYSYRARQILGEPLEAPTEVASGFSFPEILQTTDNRLATIRQLQELGLNEYATAELKLIAGEAPSDPVLAYQLSELYVDAGQPLKAIGLLQRHFRNIIRHGGTKVPARFWEILYPRLYWNDITAAAEKVTLDPYLISSIIRQESGFEPTVVSSAGAVGLMQIMPQEAPAIAADAGISSEVTRQTLFEPGVNVVLGATEYWKKLQAMNGNQILAIASYNAGQTAVGQWIARTSPDDVDLFVDSIPFNETRLYVKNVIRNHYEYRRIYGNGRSS